MGATAASPPRRSRSRREQEKYSVFKKFFLDISAFQPYCSGAVRKLDFEGLGGKRDFQIFLSATP
jgi:hypothetical protein